MTDEPTEADWARVNADFEEAAGRYEAALLALKTEVGSGVIEPVPAARSVIVDMVEALLEAGQTQHQVAALLRSIARDI